MRDLTNLKTYIIDSENPHEVDDAISLEILDGYVKKIWIHISNPCLFIPQNSSIDKDARSKNSSLYLIEQYIPMLPNEIIEKANLKQNKISNTISASIVLNENGSVNKYEIVEAKIKPKYQLTYEDANEIIDIEPKEEYELIQIKKLMLKSLNYRKSQGAIKLNTSRCILKKDNNNIYLKKIDDSVSHIIVTEAMILMGYVTSLFLIKNNLSAPFRTQKNNFKPNEILEKYKDSEIKEIILKQYMGRSYISTKPSKHESLGLTSYVQCTSPLRRYLDLVVQRQVYNKVNNIKNLDDIIIKDVIEVSKSKQLEINTIYKNDKLKFLILFFKSENKESYRIIFVKWINHKRNIALVYFPDYLLEILIVLYVSIDIYCNKVYKIKFINNNNNILEFIY